MTARPIRADSAILPWPFPVLDAAETAAAAIRPEPILLPPPASPDAALAIDAAAASAIEERAARGYAEGLLQGRAEGCEQGRAEGRDEMMAATARLAGEAQRLSAIVERLGAPIVALQQPVEEAVAALALEIARCVIGGEVARSRDYLVRLIRQAIAKVPIEMGAPKVLLNPEDLDLIRSLAPELDRNGTALIADDSVEAGGCLVVAGGGDGPAADRRWHPRGGEAVSQVNLTLSSRWRSVILTLFDGEDD